MNAYSEWFGKSATVTARIPVAAETVQDIGVISDFLRRQGYRDTSSTEAAVHGVRGRKIWNLLNIGDPRRNYHSTDVTVGPVEITVKTEVDTWFGLGTEHDKAVFGAEIEMLGHLLQTGELSPAPLHEAQARRRRSDLKTFLILIGVAIVIGIGLAVALIEGLG